MNKGHGMSNFNWHFDNVELAGAISVWMTTPEADFLKLRWVSANWKVDDLEKQKDLIVRDGWLKIGLAGSFGQ
jgi:hypothetical protein